MPNASSLTAASLARFAGVALACAALVWTAARFAPVFALDARAGFVLAFGAVALEMLGLAAFAPPFRGWQAALALGLSAALLAALAGAPANGASAALLTLALGTGASALGSVLGRRIERPGQLVAVAIVSSIADLWSVLDPAAPSARVAARAIAEPERLVLFALPFPLPGTPLIPALIGGGDLVFATLYVAAFRAHGLSPRRVLGALAIGFGLGLAGLLMTLRPLPLLPLLGAAVVASDPAARSLPAREWRPVLVLSALLLAATALRLLR